MKYRITLEHSDEGYSVSVTGLPGCWSEGATEAEALANIRDAIREYLLVRDDLVRGADVCDVEIAQSVPELAGVNQLGRVPRVAVTVGRRENPGPTARQTLTGGVFSGAVMPSGLTGVDVNAR